MDPDLLNSADFHDVVQGSIAQNAEVRASMDAQIDRNLYKSV